MGAKVAALLVVLLFTIESAPLISSASGAAPSLPASLSVGVIPATLPADNLTYAAIVVSLVDKTGTPSVATNDTLVYLSSALESIGRVQPSVTIGLGKNFVVANFTTTKTPGKTLITASSTGLQSASASVSTLVARGYPTHLIMTAVPDTVTAKRNNFGGLIITLEDDAGLPAKAVTDTTLNLYSSNKKVLNVTETTSTIRAGQFLHVVNYTTAFVPGSAVITVSASGYSTGITSVTVLGLPPLALKLYAQPNVMPTCTPALQAVAGACIGRLVVAVIDEQGNPVPAPRDITVFIRSSNLPVITIPQDQVKILTGDISTTATFQTTPSDGKAEITVSSPSLQSDFAIIVSSKPAVTLLPGVGQVKLYVGPATVLANHQSFSSVVVSLVTTNATGNGIVPAVNSTGPTRVVLTSSLSAVGNITQIVLTIPAWHNFAATVFTSTFQVGSTTLTASSHNMIHDQNKLATFGPIPKKIVLKTIASTFLADGSTHSALQVGLQDSFGSPALAPTFLPINLTSSQNGVAKVFPTVIKAGQSFAITNVTTGVIPGTANVTAVAKLSSGYVFSSTLLNTVVPAPSAIAVFVAPGKGIQDKTRGPFMVIQLQDAAANPARAREITSVTITSANTTVFDKTLRVTINPGIDFVKVPIQPKTTGSTTFTLTSPGLDSASATMTFLPQPYTVQISPVSMNMYSNQTAAISVSAQLLGKGVKGAVVWWRASSGSLTAANGTTDATGTALVQFTPPPSPGVTTILATVSHPVLGSVNLTSTFVILPMPVKQRPSLAQQLLTFPYLIGVVAAAIGAVVAVFVVIIRRRMRGKGDLGEDAGFDLAVSDSQ